MAQLVNCTLKKCSPQSEQFGNKHRLFKYSSENLPISLFTASAQSAAALLFKAGDARLRHCWAVFENAFSVCILIEQKPRIGCLCTGLGSGWLILVGGGGERLICNYECGAAIGRLRSTSAPPQAPRHRQYHSHTDSGFQALLSFSFGCWSLK